MKDNGIFQAISAWFDRNFSNPEAVSLFMTLVFGLLFFELFGNFFMPVIVSIILAYLLLAPVRLLQRIKFPAILAVTIVYVVFIGLVVLMLLFFLPMLWRQLANLISVLPSAFVDIKLWLGQIVDKHPKFFAQFQLQGLVNYLQLHVTNIAQYLLKLSLSFIPNLVQIVLYLILVPLLLFFFLKDSKAIIQWFDPYLPRNRGLVTKVCNEMNGKLGAYIRGRVLEIIIISIVTFIAFRLLGLRYPMLLSVLVGLSCIVPYVGAFLVTIPVVVLALMQWGLAPHFVYLVVVYALIIALDANLLMPLLLSEAVSLHPIVIILSVIVFGGLWGIWGVFFAIPLASLLWAILQAWPQEQSEVVEN